MVAPKDARPVPAYAGRPLPNPGDILAFPLNAKEKVRIEWTSVGLGNTLQTAYYYKIRCWWGSVNPGLKTRDRIAESFKPIGETIIFIAAEFLDAEYKNGPPCMRKYHLKETWGWEDNTWAYPMIDSLYDFGQTAAKNPALRWIAYHPPTVTNATPRDMFQHRFMGKLYSYAAKSVSKAAASLPWDEAEAASKVAGAGLDLLEHMIGHRLHQFAEPTAQQKQKDRPLTAEEQAQVKAEEDWLKSHTEKAANKSEFYEIEKPAPLDPQLKVLSEADVSEQNALSMLSASAMLQEGKDVIGTALEEIPNVPDEILDENVEAMVVIKLVEGALLQPVDPNRVPGSKRQPGWRKKLAQNSSSIRSVPSRPLQPSQVSASQPDGLLSAAPGQSLQEQLKLSPKPPNSTGNLSAVLRPSAPPKKTARGKVQLPPIDSAQATDAPKIDFFSNEKSGSRQKLFEDAANKN